MKKFYYPFLLLMLLSFAVSAQKIPPVIQWQKCETDRFKDVLQADNGDFICVGSSESDNGDLSGLHSYMNGTTYTANSDLWIMRISVTGVIKWSKLLGGTGADAAQVVRAQWTADM